MRSSSRTISAGFVVLLFVNGCSSKESADIHRQKGDEYLSRSLLKEAEIEYRAAVQADPRRGDIRMKLADTLMHQAPGAALKEYVRAADLMPGDADAQLRAGILLLVAGAFEDAQVRAKAAIAADPKNAAARILLGNALAQLKDPDGALASYREALDLNPAKDSVYGNIAILQLSRGQHDQAEASYRKAIEVAPASAQAHLALANFLWLDKKTDEAEQLLKKAVTLEPKNLLVNQAIGSLYVQSKRARLAEPYFRTAAEIKNTPASYMGLSDYYVQVGEFEKARTLLNGYTSTSQTQDAAQIRLAAVDAAQGLRASALSRLRGILDKDPKLLPARLLMAQLLLRDGKLDESLAQASAIVKDQPNAPAAGDAYLVIGDIAAARGRGEEASNAYSEAIKRQAQPLAAELRVAAIYLNQGQLDAAMTAVDQARTIQSDNAEARTLMVRIHVARGDTQKAKEELASLATEFPQSIAVFELTGDVALKEGRYDAARSAYTTALKAWPADEHAIKGLVQMAMASHRLDEALALVDSARKRQLSGDFPAFAAQVYISAGKLSQAEDVLVQAIKARPDRSSNYGLLGALYARQNRLDDARERFEDAIQHDPSSVALKTVLAMLFDLQRKTAEAEQQDKTVLALDPRAPVAANNLAWLYARDGRNLDEALQLARTALQGLPDDPEVQDTLGWVYYQKHMTADAIRHLETSVNKHPDASAHYHLGLAYWQAGDFVRAKQSLQRALTIATDFDGAADARARLSKLGA